MKLTATQRYVLSLLTAMSALASAEGAPLTAGKPVPKVVVNILVDQLRSDYLQAFMPLYGDAGFRRLLREGRVYAQAEYPLAAHDRAAAAATVATGTTPSDHGIIALRWLDRATLRPVFCVDDAAYAGVRTTEGSSPKHLGVSTLGDELKVATEGAAQVYSIAPFREAAILSAGHAADGVVWIDDRTGQWCTTSYYGTLPSWAAVRNNGSLMNRLGNLTWKPSSELVGNFSYFLSGGMKRPFAHSLKGEGRFAAFKTTGLVNEEVAALADHCISGTTLGTDGITDYLSVMFYAGNFENRSVSAAPMELQDIYVRLDRALADLIGSVERKVGLQNALFVLTSTGTEEEEDEDLTKYRIPSGTLDMKRTAALLNMYLVAIYGQGQYVDAVFGRQLYLNHELLERKQLKLNDVLDRVQDFLLQISGIKDVYTSQRLLQGAWTPGISRIRNGYNARFSGDVMIEVAPGWRYVHTDTRESRLVVASYIPFPLFFFGYGLPAATVETPVTVDYVAPTLSQAMRIRAPNACNVKPLGFGL